MVLECGCKEKQGRVIIGKTQDAATANAGYREILVNLFVIRVLVHVSRLAVPRSWSLRVLQSLPVSFMSFRVFQSLSWSFGVLLGRVWTLMFKAVYTDRKTEISSSSTSGTH